VLHLVLGQVHLVHILQHRGGQCYEFCKYLSPYSLAEIDRMTSSLRWRR
jgi:hypothetical protein